MSEADLQREIQIAVSKTRARLFRNNVAQGWIGVPIGPLAHDATLHIRKGSVIVADARRLHSGLCIGSSDLIGWLPDGRFIAIEVKSPRGIVTAEQSQFITQVNATGGLGIIARSVEDVLKWL